MWFFQRHCALNYLSIREEAVAVQGSEISRGKQIPIVSLWLCFISGTFLFLSVYGLNTKTNWGNNHSDSHNETNLLRKWGNNPARLKNDIQSAICRNKQKRIITCLL